jgi:hypothetical protein
MHVQCRNIRCWCCAVLVSQCSVYDITLLSLLLLSVITQQDVLVPLASLALHMQERLHKHNSSALQNTALNKAPAAHIAHTHHHHSHHHKPQHAQSLTQSSGSSSHNSALATDLKLVIADWGIGLGTANSVTQQLHSMGKKNYKEFCAVEMRARSLVEAMKVSDSHIFHTFHT